MTSYTRFASVYDALMDEVDYDGWTAYYLELMARYGVRPSRMADLACGTGSMTLRMAAQGIQLTGVDLSADMLRVAGDKARAKCLQIPFVRQELTQLRLHRPMDALLCACDGVNYLTTLEDVKKFFEAAYAALKPGGGLFFDISSAHKLEYTLGNRCLGEEREHIAYFWQNHFDVRTRLLQMDLTFFAQGADGRFERFRETHLQRAHTAGEVLALLTEAGFTGGRAFGDRAFTAPKEDAQRIHFGAVKPVD